MILPWTFLSVALSLISLAGNASVAAVKAGTAELRVEIVGLKSDRGEVIFVLYKSARTFTNQAFRTESSGIQNRKCVWVTENLPSGDYAMVVVHDENGNHRMDRNFLGITKEPYAFSNDVRARFKAPSFDSAKFEVGPGANTIQIKLK